MTTKLLKIFSLFVVITCVSLCTFITPSIEKTDSTLVYNSSFDVVPYVENNESVATTNSNIASYTALATYTGTVTGYGPDCSGCSGITASGLRVATIVDGKATNSNITYEDSEFGTVRILAASNNFPFGTIVRISGSRIDGYITGIILDRGGAMNNAYASGQVLMDLLFPTEKEKEVYVFGRQKNVTFEILRYGYNSQ